MSENENNQKRIRNTSRPCPDSLKAIIKAVNSNDQTVATAEQLRLWKMNLHLIARNTRAGNTQTGIRLQLTVLNQLYIIPSQGISIGRDWFLDAIEGVEARRIRLCLECEEVFWAGKLNQEFCSQAHSGKYRVRKWRERQGKE